MTTVYGVTRFGAKLQIERQLVKKEFPPEHMFEASWYLVAKTFQCLHQKFSATKEIQVQYVAGFLLVFRLKDLTSCMKSADSVESKSEICGFQNLNPQISE